MCMAASRSCARSPAAMIEQIDMLEMKRRGHTRTDFRNQVGLRQHSEQRRLRRDEASHRGEQRRAQVGDAQARVLRSMEGIRACGAAGFAKKGRGKPAVRYVSHTNLSYIAFKLPRCYGSGVMV